MYLVENKHAEIAIKATPAPLLDNTLPPLFQLFRRRIDARQKSKIVLTIELRSAPFA
jgi:hypothetical protein